MGPKYLDTEFFEEHQFELVQTLRDAHLLGFAELHCSYAPNLVRAFFQKLTFTSDPSLLTTSVKGVEIFIRADDWDEIMGYRGQGAAAFDGSDFHEFDDYRRDEFAATIVRPGMPTLVKFSSRHLTIPARVLHYLITHTIIPRPSNHAKVLNVDLFVMWAIMRREHIFWPDTFSRIMMVAKRNKSAALPYPLLVQRIMELKRVRMTGETMVTLKGNHRFDGVILKKAGLHRVDGEWRWDDPTGALAADAEDVAVEEMDAPGAGALVIMDEDAQTHDQPTA